MNLFSPWQLEVLQEQLQPCRANLLVHGPCLHHCNHRNKVISHLWKPKSVPLASSGSDGVPTSNDIQFLEPTSWDELIHEGRRMKDVIKIGRRGVCLDVVEHIKKRWHTSKVCVQLLPPTSTHICWDHTCVTMVFIDMCRLQRFTVLASQQVT